MNGLLALSPFSFNMCRLNAGFQASLDLMRVRGNGALAKLSAD
jgi:hypothetical protein